MPNQRLVLFITLLLLTGNSMAFDDPEVTRAKEAALRPGVLPAWETRAEINSSPVTVPFVTDMSQGLLTPPPDPGYRVPAEFEPVSAYMVSQGDWGGMDNMLLNLIKGGTLQGGAHAIVLSKDPPQQYASYLENKGIDMSMIRVIQPPGGLNAKWARDFGPVSIYEGGTDGNLAFADFHYYDSRARDDAVVEHLAQLASLERFGLEGGDQSPADQVKLYMEGGNYMTDGRGTCIMSNDIPADNQKDGNTDADSFEKVEEILASYLGCVKIIWLTPVPNTSTGHVDMYAKLVTPIDVIVIDFDSATGNNAQADPIVDENADIIENETNLDGEGFIVHRVVIPPLDSGMMGWTYKTYTNSVMLNNVVLVPTYNAQTYDTAALDLYRDILGEDYTVQGIPAVSIAFEGGAVHCTTMQIASACGNGVRDEFLFEQCEGDDLDGETCESLGEKAGQLACDDACNFDTSGCTGSDSDTDADTDSDSDTDADSDSAPDGGQWDAALDEGIEEDDADYAGGCGCSYAGSTLSGPVLLLASHLLSII